MKTKQLFFIIVILLVALRFSQPKLGLAKTLIQSDSTSLQKVYLPLVLKPGAAPPPPPSGPASITLGVTNDSQGITLDSGGDVDTRAVTKGNPPVETRATGNGQALPSGDGNTIPDAYMQFNVDDSRLFQLMPGTRVRVEVDYFDAGTDTFSLQYDGQAGLFLKGGTITKSNTNTFKTARFNVCDPYFGNRDSGADFRLTDNGNGAEYVRAVRVVEQGTGGQTIPVDSYGANPLDRNPDSNAIQAALDSSCSGDTIAFTSGVHTSGYQGYLINKTLFLTGLTAKHDLTFTSTNPSDHALLQATADLKGYVVRLYARSRINNAGSIDNINFGYIDVNGAWDSRVCFGPNSNPANNPAATIDNWGSWLPECSTAGDSWCWPGNIGMDGGADLNDPTQNYQTHPSSWSTGIFVHDVVDREIECGSALSMMSAASTIQNVTIDAAGDHVHAATCAHVDPDGDLLGWADGITLTGPNQTVTGNHITNPTDVGIVTFGGKNTIITNNVIEVTAGNNGAFAGIGVHSWSLGDDSGTQITGNTVTSAGDLKCGGLHSGINIGPHMWEAGCYWNAHAGTYGNSGGTCTPIPSPTNVVPCTGSVCQVWAYLPAGSTLTMSNNTVTGANINYFIEGLVKLGSLVDTNNVSHTPRTTDWSVAKTGCHGVTWGALDRVAHLPTLPGYTDLYITCER